MNGNRWVLDVLKVAIGALLGAFITVITFGTDVASIKTDVASLHRQVDTIQGDVRDIRNAQRAGG